MDGAEPQAAVNVGALSADWDIRAATSTEQAEDLIARGDIKVGLMVLDRADRPAPSDEDLVLLGGNMEWVAVVSPEGLEAAEFRNFIGQGFFDFHTLPADYSRLGAVLGHAYGMAQLKSFKGFPNSEDAKREIVSTSPAMQCVFACIRKMATADAPVLIQGESGTGKELTAQAIHRNSGRAKGPFVAVNCGALPPGLIQSELFGYEAGAFTGAARRKIGRIEDAANGTLFLDEIGDLSLDLQVNLLRFLQEQTIERVGGREPIQLDVRVIAATHVDLEKSVAEGRFREDLYYRLNVLRLQVPALSDRPEDIEPLALHYYNRFITEKSKTVEGFSTHAMQAMKRYSWPGNVRELINRIRRAMVMCERRLITPTDLGLERRFQPRRLRTLAQARDAADRNAITVSLRHAQNNVTVAARELGVARVTLYRLMKKYGITS